jgi:hypothetical protein
VAAEDELLRLLDDAAAVVAGYGEMNLYCGFDTGAEFASELGSLRERVAQQDWSALGRLVGIFAPTGAWDDGVGAPGMHLANRVMAVLDEMEWLRRTRRCT